MSNRDHFEEHLATPGEALREYAYNAGMDNPEAAWILTSRDIWMANPFYTGEPQPHPADDSQHLAYFEEMLRTDRELENRAAPVKPEDDCPF